VFCSVHFCSWVCLFCSCTSGYSCLEAVLESICLFLECILEAGVILPGGAPGCLFCDGLFCSVLLACPVMEVPFPGVPLFCSTILFCFCSVLIPWSTWVPGLPFEYLFLSCLFCSAFLGTCILFWSTWVPRCMEYILPTCLPVFYHRAVLGGVPFLQCHHLPFSCIDEYSGVG